MKSQKQKRIDSLSSQTCLQLIQEFNNTKQEWLELLAKVFGDSTNPISTVMTDLDSNGFTINYYQVSQEGEEEEGGRDKKGVLKEIRIQFDAPIQTPLQVQTKLFLLAKEANNKLLKTDKSYKKPLQLFVNPNPYVLGLALTLWASLIWMSFYESLPSSLENVRKHLHGQEGMQRILLSIIIMHLMECIVALFYAFWSKLPPSIIIKYIPTIFILGIASLKDCIRAAYRYQAQEFRDIK